MTMRMTDKSDNDRVDGDDHNVNDDAVESNDPAFASTSMTLSPNSEGPYSNPLKPYFPTASAPQFAMSLLKLAASISHRLEACSFPKGPKDLIIRYSVLG